MGHLSRLVFIGVGALAAHDVAQGQSRADADLDAAEKLGFPGLHLLDTRHADQRLSLLGIRLGYVEAGVRLGESGRYFCGALTSDQAVTAAGPVSSGIARLPYTTVRAMGLSYVILCGGAKSYNRGIGGIPVPPLDLLMLDVGLGSNGAYLEAIVLHELYHMAELRINELADADWEQQFTGYANAYLPELLGRPRIGGGSPGFLNSYSQTFPYEERAELFSQLLVHPDQVVAHLRATNDEVLRRKIRYMDDKARTLLGLKLAPDGLD
jgi:hypothetical protein